MFGEADPGVVTNLRRIQERYSGLAYQSAFFSEDVFFQPVLEPDPGDTAVEFLYAVHPTTASCAGAALRPDGTVLVGWEDQEVAAFPSLDHLLNCDALLAWRAGLPRAVLPTADSSTVISEPRFTRIDAASGYTSEWFFDREVLIHVCSTWNAIWAGGESVVRTWALDGRDPLG